MQLVQAELVSSAAQQSLQLATCSRQRAACCSLGTLKSSLSHHQLSSTELAPQSWLLSGAQRHLTTNICDIKCCNRGRLCLAVAVASAAAASLSSHPATRRAHFTNLMKTFAVARPGLACPIVSLPLSLPLSVPQQIDGLARATAVAFACLRFLWKLQPATAAAAAAAADSDCINNLCSPWKIIDQVCLFAVLGRRHRSVVAFNLLAARADRRLCGLCG